MAKTLIPKMKKRCKDCPPGCRVGKLARAYVSRFGSCV